MAPLQLSYFDFDGGRGETARLALTLAGIDFVDNRIALADWAQQKPHTPYGGLPLLVVDNKTLAQSNAINRYIGRLTNLYPQDLWNAAICDEILEGIEDIAQRATAVFHTPETAETKSQRIAFVQGPLVRCVQTIEAHLPPGKRYFVEDRLTVVDLRVFVWLTFLHSGQQNEIPTHWIESVAPRLATYFQQQKNHPDIVDYYRKRTTNRSTP